MMNKNIKWRRVTNRLVVVLISAAATTVIVWAAVNSGRKTYQVGRNEIKTKSVEKLEGLRQKYATVRSVHIAADAKITLSGANSRSGPGSYEYWAEGERYKIKCHTYSRLGFLPDVDVAYDGKRFYYFDHASGILSFQQQDVTKTSGALPNPLFLPVDFLSIDDDDCHFCALRWADFKSHSVRWDNRASGMEVKSQGKDESTGHTLTDLEMPGGTKAKRAFKIHLRMAETPDGKMRPIRIDHVGLDGKLVTSVTFDNFVSSALGDFPRTINLEGFDEGGNLVARMVYTVTTLEINQPIENSTFAIGFDEAEGIWDSDGKKFVKEKPAKPVRH